MIILSGEKNHARKKSFRFFPHSFPVTLILGYFITDVLVNYRLLVDLLYTIQDFREMCRFTCIPERSRPNDCLVFVVHRCYPIISLNHSMTCGHFSAFIISDIAFYRFTLDTYFVLMSSTSPDSLHIPLITA